METTTSAAIPEPMHTTLKLTRTKKQKARMLRQEYARVLDAINFVKSDLTSALNNFDYVADPEAIDTLIYQIQTSKCRYDTLIKELESLNFQIKYLHLI